MNVVQNYSEMLISIHLNEKQISQRDASVTALDCERTLPVTARFEGTEALKGEEKHTFWEPNRVIGNCLTFRLQMRRFLFCCLPPNPSNDTRSLGVRVLVSADGWQAAFPAGRTGITQYPLDAHRAQMPSGFALTVKDLLLSGTQEPVSVSEFVASVGGDGAGGAGGRRILSYRR